MVDLKKKRLAKGLTQDEVARAASLSRTGYVNIENGRRAASIKTAMLLGKILDFNWPDMYEGENDDTAGDRKQQ